MNEQCLSCEVSLMCITGAVDAVFKCGRCGRHEAAIGAIKADSTNFFHCYIVSTRCQRIKNRGGIVFCEECLDETSRGK